MSQAVILKCLRTPIGKFQGGLAALTAPELAAPVVKALLERFPGLPVTEAILGSRHQTEIYVR